METSYTVNESKHTSLLEEGFMPVETAPEAPVQEQFQKLSEISINAADFEKLVALIGVIIRPMDFAKKFKIELDYDPENPRVKIKYEPDDIKVDEALKKKLRKFYSKLKPDELMRARNSMAEEMTAEKIANMFILECERNQITIKEMESAIKSVEIYCRRQVENLISKCHLKAFPHHQN